MITGTEEKRRLPRIKLKTPLRYQIRGLPELNETVSDNVSLGGIGFINDRFIAPKTLVMLEINVLSRVLRPLGKIAWAASLPRSDNYRIGVEFLELDRGEKNYLTDYVDMQMGRL